MCMLTDKTALNPLAGIAEDFQESSGLFPHGERGNGRGRRQSRAYAYVTHYTIRPGAVTAGRERERM